MFTYDMSKAAGPMYKYIYERIKADIESGNIGPHEKMPSRRALAENLGVSTITIENAYDQLILEGYLEAEPRRGYFTCDIGDRTLIETPVLPRTRAVHKKDIQKLRFSFSSDKAPAGDFPFSIWARLNRRTLSMMENELLEIPPVSGILPLRQAIADHLSHFRGMQVDPDQIFTGAGTEYLYGMLVKLLGSDLTYCIEDPGYKKLKKIYESCGAVCRTARMDQNGIQVKSVNDCKADVVHISPTHHFPTGITMPVARRYEILSWANEKEGRYIIEDDYDSEFRLTGSPIPSLKSLDAGGKVIYMNTFSKSLAPTIRISYMVLPPELAEKYMMTLGFYSCTVPNIEQYTLAAFIGEGYFEKHINRMRIYYKKKREEVLSTIKYVLGEENYRIVENNAGLHFMLELKTRKKDSDIKAALENEGIKIEALSDFYMDGKIRNTHLFIISYSNMDIDELKKALKVLKRQL
jgi:GntR family transcriptional regulator/MocR family aminotransferase